MTRSLHNDARTHRERHWQLTNRRAGREGAKPGTRWAGCLSLRRSGKGGARRIISFLFGFVSRTYREAGRCPLYYLPSVLSVRLSALSPGMISAATQIGRRDQTRRRKRGSRRNSGCNQYICSLSSVFSLLISFRGQSVVTLSCCRSRVTYSRARLVWTKLLNIIRVVHSINTRPVLCFTYLFKWPAHSLYSRCLPQRQLSLMSSYAWDWARPRSSPTSPGVK